MTSVVAENPNRDLCQVSTGCGWEEVASIPPSARRDGGTGSASGPTAGSRRGRGATGACLHRRELNPSNQVDLIGYERPRLTVGQRALSWGGWGLGRRRSPLWRGGLVARHLEAERITLEEALGFTLPRIAVLELPEPG